MEEEFIKLYEEVSIETGKYLQSDITGYRAIEIIREVFKRLKDKT